MDKYIAVISSCETDEQLYNVINWKDKTIDNYLPMTRQGNWFSQGAIAGAINCMIKKFNNRSKK